MKDKFIKQCGLCKKKFTVEDLIFNPELEPIGMAFVPQNKAVFYFYQHNTPDCGTSFLIEVEAFREYVKKQISGELLFGTKDCKKHCVHIDDLEECASECYNAPFRRFLLYMLDQKSKKHQSSTVTK